jgi:ATP-dependent DNA helicase RecG
MQNDSITDHFRLLEPQKRALARLGVKTVRDLLYHFPARYERSGDQKTVSGLEIGTDAILYGTIRKPETRKSWRSKRPMSEAWLEDGTGRVKLMWFNQPYIAKMLSDGAMVKVSGRVEGTTSKYIANPEVEQVAALPLGGEGSIFQVDESDDELFAVYAESKGVTSRWFRHAIDRLLKEGVHEAYEDPIPQDILKRYNLPSLGTALVWMHTPRTEKNAQAARKRMAFEEVFVIQIAKQRARKAHDAEPTLVIEGGRDKARAFIKRLPFAPTTGQEHAIDMILGDMAHPPAMSRLLEGDVGSGKTAVAAATAYTVVTSSPKNRPSAPLQVAYMAPTEILAEQHFASFCELFGHLPIQMGLVTGTVCRKFPSKLKPGEATKVPKTQMLKWVANGEIAILIGTHALIQKKVQFRELAYVIIDEQHRFGTLQRQALVRKDGIMPHLLSMTATPIPRTLALTLYGDLDLTVLDEMPPGRKHIITEIVGKTGRVEMYAKVRRELDQGRQAYVICPRIDEPDPTKEMAVQTRSVLAEAAQLRLKEFSKYRVGVLHGQMKPAEKEIIMRTFLAHEIDVLVATSVIEVGVNVPNATSIIIEGAERFGLAQLHQLRGRVVRSNHQAYCYVLTSEGNTSTRLKALEKAKNGFELAELDLKIRGPGELYGRSQSGITDLGMEALKNLKMVEAARSEAIRIVNEDSTLAKHPVLAEVVAERGEKLHFE